MNSLEMFQLVSPSLPVGAFSYSEGLEWLVQNKKVSDELTLNKWLKSELLRGQIRIEAAAQSHIRAALQDWIFKETANCRVQVEEWDSWLLALRDATSIRSQQRQMGQSLMKLLLDLGHSLPDQSTGFTWPIAWAWAGIAWKLEQSEVINGYLYSWVANQLNAALRLLPLGPTKAQNLQCQLNPIIKDQGEMLSGKNPHNLWAGDMGATMAQLSHAELYSRLFRS